MKALFIIFSHRSIDLSGMIVFSLSRVLLSGFSLADLCYNSDTSQQNQTRVELNRVCLPRYMLYVDYFACGIARY